MRRVIAITGASAGIGRATAIRFARDGASIAICARRRDRLDRVAQEIIDAGGTALPLVADVAQDADMQAFVDQTVSRWGQLDVIVCNAGYGVYGTIDLSRMPGTYVVSRTITDAATMFDTGPASEDSAQPRLGLRIAAGLIGIGLPQPIGPIRIISVPIGSRCFNGLSVSRPRVGMFPTASSRKSFRWANS